MQQIPREPPLILRWREHLLKMRDCTYVVDNAEVRFVKFKIFTDTETVVLYTTARYHTVKFNDMPEFLRKWIPKQVDGMPYYDHVFDELGIAPGPDNNLPDTVVESSKEITPEERLKSMYVEFMGAMLKDMESVHKTLKDATLNIKDVKSGPAGKDFVTQASQLANLGDKMIKGKLAAIQGFNVALKIMDLDKKHTKKPKDNEQAGNDNEKD